MWSLPIGQKVVLPFDRFKCPTTNAAALYAQFLGNCAKDTIAFPINFEDWRKIPKTLKNKYFNDNILVILSRYAIKLACNAIVHLSNMCVFIYINLCSQNFTLRMWI